MSQRRQMIVRSVAIAAALCASALPGFALAQAAKLKVAGVYTVPFEQQWVSRLHKALKAIGRCNSNCGKADSRCRPARSACTCAPTIPRSNATSCWRRWP